MAVEIIEPGFDIFFQAKDGRFKRFCTTRIRFEDSRDEKQSGNIFEKPNSLSFP